MLLLLEKKKWTLTEYSKYIEKDGNPIDELGLVLAAKTIQKHIAVMLNGFIWWSTREDGDWTKCEVLFAYCGKMKFMLIEQVPMHILNMVADSVGLDGRRLSTRRKGKRGFDTISGQNVNEHFHFAKMPRIAMRNTNKSTKKKKESQKLKRSQKTRASKTKGKALLKRVLATKKRRSPNKNSNKKAKVCAKNKRKKIMSVKDKKMSVKEKNGKNIKEGNRNNGVQNLIEVFTNEDESKREKSGDLLEVVINEEKCELDTTYKDGQKSMDTNFKQGGNESDTVDRGVEGNTDEKKNDNKTCEKQCDVDKVRDEEGISENECIEYCDNNNEGEKVIMKNDCGEKDCKWKEMDGESGNVTKDRHEGVIENDEREREKSSEDEESSSKSSCLEMEKREENEMSLSDVSMSDGNGDDFVYVESEKESELEMSIWKQVRKMKKKLKKRKERTKLRDKVMKGNIKENGDVIKSNDEKKVGEMVMNKKCENERYEDREMEKKNKVSEEDEIWEEIDYEAQDKKKKKKGNSTKSKCVVKTFGVRKRRKRVYKCMETGCGDLVFNSVTDRTKHAKDMHGIEEMKCDKCGVKCTTQYSFKKHMESHEKAGKHPCTVCTKTFSHGSHLKRHMLNHTNEKLYKCIVGSCQSKGTGKFKRKTDLIRHMEKHKGNSFKCKECGKIWESAKELYDHSNRVHREKLSCQNSEKWL